MRIGLFSLKNGVGCTSLSIHVANFLASNENNKVAIKELCKEGKYKTVKADFADDKTFFINDVHFYPYEVTAEPTEAFIIDDIGKIGLLHKFNKDYDKLYLCTDGSDEDLSEFLDYRNEVEYITPDILLFGGSKDCIHKWQNEGFKVVLIGRSREKRIPQNFAMILSTFLRTKGITPPVYHSDSMFAPVIFGNEPLPDVEEDVVTKENAEPKPLSSKVFVKVPAPTDTYKAPQVTKDDGLGITQTQTESLQRMKNKKSNDVVDNNEDKQSIDTDVENKPVVNKPLKEKKNDKKMVEDIDVDDEEVSNKKKVSKPLFSSVSFKKPSIKSPFHKKDINNEENEEDIEEEYESSMLGDIPMQGVDFSFDTQLTLKDLSSYSLFINKHFTCIGLNNNVRKKHYDNTDGTLLHLTKINREILQFMTEDLLSGDYVLSRFSDSEINSMRIYFDFMCGVFRREIGKTVTLREYVEFKQYYNRLCETKIMLDAEENERVRIIHDIYLRYTPYAELYNMNVIPEQELLDNNIECFVSDLSFILNEHICDEDVKDVIKGLIDEIIALKPAKTVEETMPELVLEDVTIEDNISDPNTKDTRYSTSINETSEERALSADDISNLPYRIRVVCFNEDETIEDNATYSLMNIERAVFTYMQKACFMKKLLLINEDNVTIPLFSSKNGGIIIPIKGDFNNDIVKIKEHIERIMSTF